MERTWVRHHVSGGSRNVEGSKSVVRGIRNMYVEKMKFTTRGVEMSAPSLGKKRVRLVISCKAKRAIRDSA